MVNLIVMMRIKSIKNHYLYNWTIINLLYRFLPSNFKFVKNTNYTTTIIASNGKRYFSTLRGFETYLRNNMYNVWYYVRSLVIGKTSTSKLNILKSLNYFICK